MRARAYAMAMLVAAASCSHPRGSGPADAAMVDAAADAASVHDAGVDAGPDAAFPCGTDSCADDQYCYEVEAGVRGAVPPPPDANPWGPSCNAIPSACEPSPTCPCLMQHATSSCPITPFCEVRDGHLYLICALP